MDHHLAMQILAAVHDGEKRVQTTGFELLVLGEGLELLPAIQSEPGRNHRHEHAIGGFQHLLGQPRHRGRAIQYDQAGFLG